MKSTVGSGSTSRAFTAGPGKALAAPRPNMLAVARALGVEPSRPSMNEISALRAGEHPRRRRSAARHDTHGSKSVPVDSSTSVNASDAMSVPGRAGAPGGSLPGLKRLSG